MISLDGTENKGKLGANAILAVSMAVCKVRGVQGRGLRGVGLDGSWDDGWGGGGRQPKADRPGLF